MTEKTKTEPSPAMAFIWTVVVIFVILAFFADWSRKPLGRGSTREEVVEKLGSKFRVVDSYLTDEQVRVEVLRWDRKDRTAVLHDGVVVNIND